MLFCVISTICVMGLLSCQKGFGEGLLTPKQVMSQWESMYRGDFLLTNSERYHMDKFWIADKDTMLTRDELYERMEEYIGGPIRFWKFRIEGVSQSIFCNSGGSPGCPVSSRGTKLTIVGIPASTYIVEDIYLLSDTTVVSYGVNDLRKIGWSEGADHTYIFRIPKNDTGKTRLWCVKLFAEGRSYYDEKTYLSDFQNHDVSMRNTRWPLVNLCFVQVTDTVNPSIVFGEGYSKSFSLIPRGAKWIPDPEGGYQFDNR